MFFSSFVPECISVYKYVCIYIILYIYTSHLYSGLLADTVVQRGLQPLIHTFRAVCRPHTGTHTARLERQGVRSLAQGHLDARLGEGGEKRSNLPVQTTQSRSWPTAALTSYFCVPCSVEGREKLATDEFYAGNWTLSEQKSTWKHSLIKQCFSTFLIFSTAVALIACGCKCRLLMSLCDRFSMFLQRGLKAWSKFMCHDISFLIFASVLFCVKRDVFVLSY